MKLLLLLVISAASFCEIDAQIAAGIVFNDLNRNSRLDPAETGIPNVAVSNGLDVVLTGSNGEYRIPVEANSQVFVIKPAGYSFPKSEVNLPQYYYQHYPMGSAVFRNGGIPPTGDLPAQINFALLAAREDSVFKAVIFGDTQVRNADEIDFLARDVIAELALRDDLVFGTILGDIVYDKTGLYASLNQVNAALGIPMFNVPGNHDVNYDATSDRQALESFRQVYGPENYAFNYGKVHFILMDNIIYSGDTLAKAYQEGFTDELLAFVANDLKFVPENNLIVLMMHAPLLNTQTLEPIKNVEKLLALLDSFPHTFSLSGHSHILSHQFLTKEKGWKIERPHHHYNIGAACGAWWLGSYDDQGIPDAMMQDGSPNGYAIVSFINNSCVVDYKAARRPADYQMNIVTSPVISRNRVPGNENELTVNFFTGSERDTLMIRFDDGAWYELNRTPGPDPVLNSSLKSWEDKTVKVSGRKPPSPIISSHLWKTTIPADLDMGMHKAEVMAKDIFGRKHTAFHFFRVE